ncbi:hypothetical protein F511_03274 [Dorcoceras hygrometricum]|uniref:Reverse transcriptase domain-containing protein n=1 Tax=Dorcoceras hygrometricum TaxID=472368 RepID=A0A2Z7B2B2_9LAMI|nr:hypothetical protein F511_03274 [Dorcoceras hygrometricum]
MISHLTYADDIVIFANGNIRGIKRIIEFLHHYESCSGQSVNVHKSSIILPSGISPARRSSLLRITGFREEQLPIRYLGAPLYRGNRKCSLFDPLVQTIRKRLEGWETKTLSSGSLMTLIRSVLLSIPIYLFQVIQPPIGVMNTIERIFNSFLWGSRPNDKKWHWASWSRACLPVREGGLGFRRLKDIVTSFFCKLRFRLRQGSSLWASFLLRKYCRRSHPAGAPAATSLPFGAVSPGSDPSRRLAFAGGLDLMISLSGMIFGVATRPFRVCTPSVALGLFSSLIFLGMMPGILISSVPSLPPLPLSTS